MTPLHDPFTAPLEDRALREAAFKRTFANLGDELLQRSVSGYAPELGYATHRAAAARWLNARGVSATAEEVIVTDGAQDAFLLLLIATVKPGEAVLVEEIPYLGLKHLARAFYMARPSLALARF